MRLSGRGHVPDYCETLIRKHDYDRYISALFAPEAVRAHLFALYAFNYEIARIAETVRDPMAGQVRLQWWRDAIDEMFSAVSGRTEVLNALSRAVAAHQLPKQFLDSMLKAREHDLESTPFADVTALEAYANATAGMLMRLAARVLGAGDTLDKDAHEAGIAYATTGLLRALSFHAARGRIVVPLREMQGAGVDTREFLCGHMSDSLSPLIDSLAEAALRHYSSVHHVNRKYLPAILAASLVPRFLKLMTRRGFNPFRDSTEIPGYRRQWTMLLAMSGGRI